jgi:hypothetical protein
MKYFFKQRSEELLLTLFSFLSCFIFFTLVTDDYTSFSSNCAEGQFSDYPYCIYYWGYLGIAWVYRILYNAWPRYDWLSMSLLFFEFCALYLILRVIKKVIMKDTPYKSLVRAIQFLFALFFFENIIYLSHTRSSLLFCGIALLNLVFPDKVSKRDSFIYTLLFILGMLIRPESSIGMILLVSIGFLCYRFDLIHLARRSFFPVLATSILFIGYSIDWSNSDLFLKKVEPEIEYKLMEKRVTDISVMHTAVDSVKYQATVAGLCFDTRVLTPAYFRKILVPGVDMSLAHIKLRFFHIISLYKYYLFIPFFSMMLLLLCIVQWGSWIWVFRICIFEATTFGIIYFADYTGGLICGRHFLNLQIISLLILLFYFFKAENGSIIFWRKLKLLSAFCFLFVLYGIKISLNNYKSDSTGIAEDTYCYEQAMQNIDSSYTNRIIILTTNNFHLFDHTFSITNKKYTHNTYLMYDVWTYCLFPEYTHYLAKECNCDPLNPDSFFNWLASKRALYIAEPWRFDLTARYMNIVHGQKLKFAPDYQFKKPECIKDRTMGKFELKQVNVEY